MHCTRESNENRFSFLFAVNAAPPERAIDNIAVVHSRECDTIIYDFFYDGQRMRNDDDNIVYG